MKHYLIMLLLSFLSFSQQSFAAVPLASMSAIEKPIEPKLNFKTKLKNIQQKAEQHIKQFYGRKKDKSAPKTSALIALISGLVYLGMGFLVATFLMAEFHLYPNFNGVFFTFFPVIGIFIGVIAMLSAIVFGIVGIIDSKNDRRSRRFAWFGLLSAVIPIVLALLILLLLMLFFA